MTGLPPVFRIRPVAMESQMIVSVAAFKRDDGSPVREGDTIYLRGAADDWDDVSPAKEPGRSEGEVEILIASAESIEGWLQRELAAMRPDLLRLRDQQRDARNRTLDVASQPDGSLIPADRDRLLGVQHLQDQIGGKITDPRDGLAAKAETLRATIRANNLPASSVTERVIRVADELARIKERDLPAIKPSLSSARELVRTAAAIRTGAGRPRFPQEGGATSTGNRRRVDEPARSPCGVGRGERDSRRGPRPPRSPEQAGERHRPIGGADSIRKVRRRSSRRTADRVRSRRHPSRTDQGAGGRASRACAGRLAEQKERSVDGPQWPLGRN